MTHTCPCGVTFNAPHRHQQHCGYRCPVLVEKRRTLLAQNRAKRTKGVREKFAGKPLSEVIRLARHEGWNKGYRLGIAHGWEQALKESA